MLTEDFILKTKIRIDGFEYFLSLLSIDNGLVTSIKLGDNVYNITQKPVAAEQGPAAAAAAPTIEPEQRHNKKWTKEEDQLLKDNYKKHGAKKIFKKNMLPRRSILSIFSRAYFLKIKKYNTKKEKIKKTNINFNKTALTT